MQCFCGVDPGLSGALAFIFEDAPDRVITEDMPTVDNVVMPSLLRSLLARLKPTVALIEAVSARPGQGVTSMFRFGQAHGTAIGVIGGLDVPYHFVTPGKWKKHYGLSSDKEECRAKALQLFPSCADQFKRKKDHGKAEAALIARYCMEMRK
jgi:crossover junction endodeoxyribonuclease RuvC